MNAVRPLSLFALAIVVGGGLFVLRHNTQSTHVATPPESTTQVVVEGRSNRAEPSQTIGELTEAHVWFCRLEIKSDVVDDLEEEEYDRNTHRYTFTLQPALDATDAKQYKGCLQDWVLAHHQLRVISMERGPDRAPGGSEG